MVSMHNDDITYDNITYNENITYNDNITCSEDITYSL
jgi:hypothetical protein